jgi:hypothetical protein
MYTKLCPGGGAAETSGPGPGNWGRARVRRRSRTPPRAGRENAAECACVSAGKSSGAPRLGRTRNVVARRALAAERVTRVARRSGGGAWPARRLRRRRRIAGRPAACSAAQARRASRRNVRRQFMRTSNRPPSVKSATGWLQSLAVRAILSPPRGSGAGLLCMSGPDKGGGGAVFIN